MEEKKKKSKLKLIIIIALLLIVLICLIIIAFRLFKTPYDDRKRYNDIRNKYYDALDSHNDVDEENEDTKNPIEVIAQDNDEIFGWITIPNTNIDYPVLKHEDDTYYISHSIEKKFDTGGAIFANCEAEANSKNIIIYGHNVRYTSIMFSDLVKYKDEAFARENNIIYCDLGNQEKWELVSVFETDITKDGAVDFQKVNFSSKQDFVDHANKIMSKSMYDFGVEFDSSDRMLTLSTCVYTEVTGDTRFVAAFKLVK